VRYRIYKGIHPDAIIAACEVMPKSSTGFWNRQRFEHFIAATRGV